MRRKRKSRDSESSKRRLPIDKLKLMPSELREPLKRVKEMLESVRDLNTKKDRESSLTLKSPDKHNLPKSRSLLLNKPVLKEKTI
jgi:hypothetical protein